MTRLLEICTSPHTVEEAFAAHIVPEAREQGCYLAGASFCEVTVSHINDTHRVVIDRRVPLELPGSVQRLLGAGITMRQEENWGPPGADGSRCAQVRVTFHGAPITMTATAVLQPTPTGSEERVEGEIKVNVPVLGRLAEPEVTNVISRSLRIEQQHGLDWLEMQHTD